MHTLAFWIKFVLVLIATLAALTFQALEIIRDIFKIRPNTNLPDGGPTWEFFQQVPGLMLQIMILTGLALVIHILILRLKRQFTRVYTKGERLLLSVVLTSALVAFMSIALFAFGMMFHSVNGFVLSLFGTILAGGLMFVGMFWVLTLIHVLWVVIQWLRNKSERTPFSIRNRIYTALGLTILIWGLDKVVEGEAISDVLPDISLSPLFPLHLITVMLVVWSGGLLVSLRRRNKNRPPISKSYGTRA